MRNNKNYVEHPFNNRYNFLMIMYFLVHQEWCSFTFLVMTNALNILCKIKNLSTWYVWRNSNFGYWTFTSDPKLSKELNNIEIGCQINAKQVEAKGMV